MRPGSSPLRKENMALAETPSKRQQKLQYVEEMDWSPITPQHRALNDDPTRTPNGFGQLGDQIPSQSESMNPFRYKVPAAPVEPARRLRNPVWSPAPKQEPPETGKVMFTRRGHQPSSSHASIGGDASGGVEFKQPSFFAAERDNDASSLADLLGQSFSLGQEQEQEANAGGQRPQQVQRQGGPVGRGDGLSPWTQSTRSEQAILTVLMALWLLVVCVPIPHGWEMQLGILTTAGAMAVRGTGDTGRLVSDTAPVPLLLYVLSALGVAELAAICWVGSEVWGGRSERVGWHGAVVLASMMGRQALSKSA